MSSPGKETGVSSPNSRRIILGLVVASIVALGLLLSGLGVFNQSAASSTSTTAVTTSFNIAAPAVISAASADQPAGYFPGLTKELTPNELGLETAAYALFSNQGGADVNMTIIVFDSQASAQRYTDSVISNVKGLLGYSNDNSTLSGYQRYGTCYAYGEVDPDGSGSVATGICSKANVYISVHIATTASLPSAESDVAGFVGAAYQAIG